jgi:hypothetical protein
VKKLGRNAVLPADAEKQFQQRIILLKQVGFKLTLNHIHRFAVQICKEHSVQSVWKGRMVGKGVVCSQKEPKFNMRKAENLSYGRLMTLAEKL